MPILKPSLAWGWAGVSPCPSPVAATLSCGGCADPWGSLLCSTSASPFPANPPPLQVPALGVLGSGWMAHSAPLPSCPPLLVLSQVPSHVPPAQKAGHSPGGHTNSWAPLLPEDSLQSRLSSSSSDLPGDERTPQSSCPVGRLRLRGLLQRGQSMLFFPTSPARASVDNARKARVC